MYECPACGHVFKNFKWKQSWRADGPAAACPQCLEFAYNWQNVEKQKGGDE